LAVDLGIGIGLGIALNKSTFNLIYLSVRS